MDDDCDPWWRNGICAEIGPDIFFVEVGESVADAKAACRLCPVRIQCLADALVSDIEYGIFGGLSRLERRRLAKRVTPDRDPMWVATRAIEQERKAS